MASGGQLLQFPFTASIDEATRDEVSESPASWATLENVRQDKRGALSKRFGFTALANTRVDATAVASGYRLLADRDSIVRIADGVAEAYSSQASAWASLGRVSDCDCRVIDVVTPGIDSPVLTDAVYANGYIVLAHVAGSVVYTTVLDAATKATVRPWESITLGSGTFPAYMAVIGTYVVALRWATAGNIEASRLDTSSASTIESGWTYIGTFVSAPAPVGNAAMSVCSMPNASTPCGAVAFVGSYSGTTRLSVVTFSHTTVLATATLTSGTPGQISLDGDGSSTLWVAWSDSLDVKVCGLDPNAITSTPLASTVTVVTLGSTANKVGIAEGPATKARVAIGDSNTSSVRFAGIETVAGVATVTNSGTVHQAPFAALAGKPLYHGGRYYMPVTDDTSNSQKTVVWADFSEATTYLRPVACPAPGLSLADFTVGTQKPFRGSDSSTWYAPIGIIRNGVGGGAALVELDFASQGRWLSASFGGGMYISGGVLSYTDGVRVSEAGFMFRPPKPTTSLGGTGITGTYRYVAVYEEVDADGNWHVSGVSDPSNSVSPANQTVTVTTRPLSLTSRRTPGRTVSGAVITHSAVRIALYRTLTGGEAPYYRLASITNASSATVSYADTTTDATLATQAKLYSQPGVLGTAQDRRPPPAMQHVVSYNGMLVGASGSDIWYSGQLVSGEGVWFNPIFSVPVPEPVTALATLDGTLLAFTRRGVYALSGEPPADNGSSGGIGLPRRLSVDSGAISPFVCSTGLGVFFRSDRGIELLTRGQTSEWVGEAVQDTLAAFPTLTAITYDPHSSCVLFELAASESGGQASGSGRTLVFDLSLKAWVSADRRLGSDVAATSACIVPTSSGDRYAWLRTNGTVYVEDRSTYLDAGSWVTMRAVSPWVKAAGIQGMQHVNRALVLAKRSTHHDLTVSVAYDYAGTYATTRLYTATQLATLTSALPNQQIEHPLGNDARGESLRIKLEDATPSTGQAVTTGQGATWVSLAFEVVPQQGAYRLPDESR